VCRGRYGARRSREWSGRGHESACRSRESACREAVRMPYIGPENDNRGCDCGNRGCDVLNRFIAKIFGFLCFSSHAFFASISAKCRFFKAIQSCQGITILWGKGKCTSRLLSLPITNN